MELIQHTNQLIEDKEVIKKSSPFIEANTKVVTLEHLKKECTIPVFAKDNEVTIAHHEFIDVTSNAVEAIFSDYHIDQPQIRTSHIIKGRIPSAIGKPVQELLEEDKTIYYERMMFKIDVPSITEEINGNVLNLTIAGVRAYNRENLYSKKGMERFTICIGFKNMVCTNLCVTSDGSVKEIRASSLDELYSQIMNAIGHYCIQSHIAALKKLPNYYLTEEQYAYLIGKLRMYHHMSKESKANVFPIKINDSQISAIVKGYYNDHDFSCNEDGIISLWRLYNLFTSANKSSYIDNFIERSVFAHEFVQDLAKSLEYQTPNWFLHN